ncbi:hypothetical protein COV13_01890 [Candidatus Woesearchaeota archaeon CG10_big_fil_rev_8_21_14_0_10_32_9]|nr:MAG: hypothetical protein COV13_01890 [Candidatus Woesearchaeota archaeon CG10_big_fil_rev_8_21_14_0_10_32_9]
MIQRTSYHLLDANNIYENNNEIMSESGDVDIKLLENILCECAERKFTNNERVRIYLSKKTKDFDVQNPTWDTYPETWSILKLKRLYRSATGNRFDYQSEMEFQINPPRGVNPGYDIAQLIKCSNFKKR